ncbi:MAG: hypothetical protein U0232_30825 [Thermomicrobiales bacterium]
MLAHDVEIGGRAKLRMGHRDRGVTADAARARGHKLHVLTLDAGDMTEEEAGRRLAAAVAGPGVLVKGWSRGASTSSLPGAGCCASMLPRCRR